MTPDLAERAARNMAAFEAARATAHGDLHHQCFLNIDEFPDTESLVKHPLGTYFWLHGANHPQRSALAQGGFTYAFPGILMALPVNAPLESTARDNRLVDSWRLADLEVHPWHGASLNAVLGDIRMAKETPGMQLWALRGHAGTTMVASCITYTDPSGTAGLYAVGVRGDVQRQGYGIELVRRVVASLSEDATLVTLQCHPMLANFYGKSAFKRAGAVEAWSRAPGRVPVDDVEAALITAVCGADIDLLQQLLVANPERIGVPVSLWNRGGTLLHLASWMADIPTVQTLIDLGADKVQKDLTHGYTAAGWARYFGRTELLPYL